MMTIRIDEFTRSRIVLPQRSWRGALQSIDRVGAPVRSRFSSFSRGKHPVLFWLHVVIYSIAVPTCILGGVFCLRAMWLGCAANSTIHTCDVLPKFW
jgi:hypothetical protein